MIKYSKFTDNIGSGNFTDTIIDKFKKSGYWWPLRKLKGIFAVIQLKGVNMRLIVQILNRF